MCVAQGSRVDTFPFVMDTSQSPETGTERRRKPRRLKLESVVASGKALREAAIAFVYPPSCVACGAATAAAHGLCASCWGAIGFIERPFCERLGTPFALDLGGTLLSPAAIANPPVFVRARAVCRYDGTARDLVHRLKYGDRLDLTRALATLMVHAGRELLVDAEVIVPVPLHRWRLWSRRFNQAAALAGAIARTSSVKADPFILARTRATRQQVGLTRAERATNLQGAFAVPDEAKPRLAGKRVLLIDDVLTTGATVNTASRVLMRAGARAIDVLTFARVTLEG